MIERTPTTLRTARVAIGSPTRILAGLVLALAAAVPAAHADTATIDVTGNIVSGSCSFRNNGDVVINLGTVQASVFDQVGKGSGFVAGNLVSGGCTGVSTIHMTFSGTADSANDQLFAPTGGAGGVGVQLRTGDASHRAIVPNDATALDFAPVAAGENYPFEAQYVSTGAVTAGGANARITVNITYD